MAKRNSGDLPQEVQRVGEDKDEKFKKLREMKDNSKKIQYPSKVNFIKEKKGVETIRGRSLMKEIQK